MPRKPTIALVGAGRVAQALAPALRRAGYRIAAVVSRDRPASLRRARALARRVGSRAVAGDAPIPGDILWLCVSDDAIASTSQRLASRWEGKWALHSSGALTSDALAPLRERGAALASVHPMMTFVADAIPDLSGIVFAVEGDPSAVREARRIVGEIDGRVFTLQKRKKVLYHIMGTFSSPMVVATVVLAERMARAAGIPRKTVAHALWPILRQTWANWVLRGARGAFSGPLARGDVDTVRKHLRTLKAFPDARAAYLALARAALRHLPARNRRELAKLLR
ncbi:MAG TPA: DUF2520 domain-containing protein [Terriglobales bacterium]|nr:DUF2520 domain-containing protein [Terriglobales bacterium]